MKNEEEESKEFVVFCDCKSKYKERKDEIETWERERERVENWKAACLSMPQCPLLWTM